VNATYFDQLIRLIPKQYYRPNEKSQDLDLIISDKITQAPVRKTGPKKKKAKEAEEEDEEEAPPAPAATATGSQLQSSGVGTQAKDIEELRERMRNKMQSMKRRRTPGMVENEASKRSKRREKKQELQKGEKKQKKQGSTKKSDKKEAKKEEAKSEEPEAAADNSPADLQFSAIANSQAAPVGRFKKGVRGGKDALALKKVQEFEETVERLKVDEPEQAEKLLHGAAVSSSLLRAAGVKVLDNKKVLKKSLKRKERAKKKSQALWKGRAREVVRQVKAGVQDGKDKRKKAKNKTAARIKGAVSEPAAPIAD